jgi:uncharacterized protein (TIGR03437 family)
MELGGTRVRISGEYVPVLYTSPMQVKFLCPALAGASKLLATVEVGSMTTDAVIVNMREAAPKILLWERASSNEGWVTFGDTPDLVMERNYRVEAHPAQPGDEVVIRATGLAGISAAMVSVDLGGAAAEVLSLDAVPGLAGVHAIRIRVPERTIFSNAAPMQLQVTTPAGERFLSNSVTVAVEPVSP